MKAYQGERALPSRIGLGLPFGRLSLAQQFLVLSFAGLAAGMLAIGTWLAREIETTVATRAAAISALYVESILVAQFRSRSAGAALDRETRAAFDRLFVDGPLRRKVVRFKLWGTDGSVLYSSDHGQIGLRFPVAGALAAAFGGRIRAKVSDLEQADNVFERKSWSQLLEVYVPVRAGTDGEVSAVAEFYHSVDNLKRDVRSAQRRGWLIIAIGTAAMYLLLIGLVRRASSTILDQQHDLRRKVTDLSTALGDNERMRERLREAGAKATALNEQFLHRVAADLHDGPAQDTALALLRFDEITERGVRGDGRRELGTVREALRSSLEEMRNIASGLRMPDIERVSLADTARRAVRDCERKFGTTIEAEIDGVPVDTSLAVKITVYRLIQESLTNGWWHTRGSRQRVRMSHVNGTVSVEIADQGPGFDPRVAAAGGRLGLAFMRERVRLLGGSFEIDSAPGRGTCVRARVPLSMGDTIHD